MFDNEPLVGYIDTHPTQRCWRVRNFPRKFSLSLSLSRSLSLHDEGEEVLAVDTAEAFRVVRCGRWVYKFLKPHDALPFGPPEFCRRALRLRVCESHRHFELNPLWLIEAWNCVASRFAAGRNASIAECESLGDHFARTGRGYLGDCGPANVRIVDGRPVVVDFVISTAHYEWRRRLRTVSPRAPNELPQFPGPPIDFAYHSTVPPAQ